MGGHYKRLLDAGYPDICAAEVVSIYMNRNDEEGLEEFVRTMEDSYRARVPFASNR